jgi:hypothetical protein
MRSPISRLGINLLNDNTITSRAISTAWTSYAVVPLLKVDIFFANTIFNNSISSVVQSSRFDQRTSVALCFGSRIDFAAERVLWTINAVSLTFRILISTLHTAVTNAWITTVQTDVTADARRRSLIDGGFSHQTLLAACQIFAVRPAPTSWTGNTAVALAKFTSTTFAACCLSLSQSVQADQTLDAFSRFWLCGHEADVALQTIVLRRLGLVLSWITTQTSRHFLLRSRSSLFTQVTNLLILLILMVASRAIITTFIKSVRSCPTHRAL